MDVNKPEILRRGMYGENPDRPEVTQENDIDASFGDVPVGIPPDLLAIVHMPRSVDPASEVIEKVNADLTVNAETVAEENPQSRFRILDTPIKKPGVCALCGDAGGDGRQFVDFGKSVEWYGVVYFCTVCVTEAAKLLGFGNVASEQNEIDRLRFEYEGLDLRQKYLQESYNAAMVLIRNCRCGPDGPYADSDEISEAELVEPEDSKLAGDATGSDEPNSDELASQQGPDDIPADSGDDQFTASGRPRRTRKSSG